jgi:hypothetical protein
MNDILTHFQRPVVALFLMAAAVTSVSVSADQATGPLADRTQTLFDLDAAYLNDPNSGNGVHFSGARVISILDASISGYYYSDGGRYDYFSVRPFVPEILVSNNAEEVREHADSGQTVTSGQITAGAFSAGIGFSGDTHAAASLATGTLHNYARYVLGGPVVGSLSFYQGVGAQGGATSQSELADYLTITTNTAVTISGVWEGSLDATPHSLPWDAISTPPGTVLVDGPSVASVLAHMEIGIYSAPQQTYHPGDGESQGYFTTSRSYLGGVSFDQSVNWRNGTNFSQPFSFTVQLPAGDFYFYAQQSCDTGVGSDASLGKNGPVVVSAEGTADFDHTLQFDLTPAAGSGAVIRSESKQFLTAAPLFSTPSFDAKGGLKLVWKVAAGHTYQVRYKDSLGGAWQNLGAASTASADGSASVTDAAPPAAGRYYQILVVN